MSHRPNDPNRDPIEQLRTLLGPSRDRYRQLHYHGARPLPVARAPRRVGRLLWGPRPALAATAAAVVVIVIWNLSRTGADDPQSDRWRTALHFSMPVKPAPVAFGHRLNAPSLGQPPQPLRFRLPDRPPQPSPKTRWL